MAFAKLIERCSDGVEDQGAEEASWDQERIVSSVLEDVFRASGSPSQRAYEMPARIASDGFLQKATLTSHTTEPEAGWRGAWENATAENAEGDHGGPKTSTIWMFAVLLGNSGWLYTLSHHQTFWIGMRFGFHMRTQMMAAVHAKVLRLNSKAISSITTGLVTDHALTLALTLTLSPHVPCLQRTLCTRQAEAD